MDLQLFYMWQLRLLIGSITDKREFNISVAFFLIRRSLEKKSHHRSPAFHNANDVYPC